MYDMDRPAKPFVIYQEFQQALKPRVADLFCGAGGLSEGFRQAGYEIVAGNDHDPDACATFQLNFPEARLVAGDLRVSVVSQALLEAAARADIVVGGPPCQAFSQVRNHVRVIDDPRNSLYREFVNVVGTLRPKAFVMENVPGMDQMGVRQQIVQDLSLQGQYKVAAQLLDAADFGVPQTRRRIIFIGIRSDVDVAPPIVVGAGATRVLNLARRNGTYPVRYEVEMNPMAEAAADLLLNSLNDAQDPRAVTARQAIEDLEGLRANIRSDTLDVESLPEPRSAYQRYLREDLGGTLTNTSVPRMNADTAMRLTEIPEGGNYRDLPSELGERYLTGERWGPDNGTGRLARRHFYAYRRLHSGFWAWTLNTKGDSVYHYSAPRALSVREFARLQSFPDRFRFTTDPRPGELTGRIEGGANHSRYRQVGNAVPPLLAKAIATNLWQTLA
jgi:DNA (cytosine-5)-methyltransferase 1